MSQESKARIQENWAKQIAEAGKYSLIHIDGTLKGLPRQECSVGVTALEGQTPAPVGDLDIEQWADYGKNSKTILWGGIPGSYFTPIAKDEKFERHIFKCSCCEGEKSSIRSRYRRPGPTRRAGTSRLADPQISQLILKLCYLCPITSISKSSVDNLSSRLNLPSLQP